MNRKETIFIRPDTHDKLFEIEDNGQSYLSDESNTRYEFVSGFPNLTYPQKLEGITKYHHDFFEHLSDDYDKYMGQTFKTHNEDEQVTRNKFIDKLNIGSSSKVLEIGSGTGRDSELIARRLGEDGQLVLLDISPSMLAVCKTKLSAFDADKVFCLANAAYLPFPDNYFDACYSFTAVQYLDIKKSLAEMTRVTKPGGKIVFGDHSMPPWLRDTYYGKVLATNPGVLAELPLNDMPVEARNVTVQWVIGSIFYLIDFEVGEGEPVGNFDYEIEGARGGTLRTRYEGKLEGVTKEARELAIKAAKAKGMTLHSWLESLVKEAAIKDLNL